LQFLSETCYINATLGVIAEKPQNRNALERLNYRIFRRIPDGNALAPVQMPFLASSRFSTNSRHRLAEPEHRR
jgi:hypothetical protein